MKKVAIETFGCKINQYESACIIDPFLKNGYQLVGFNADADVYIINSCTVTNRTDFKSRNAIRKVLERKKHNPGIKLIVTGCYVQRNSEEVLELGDIDLLIDNNNKFAIFSILNDNNIDFGNILDYGHFEEMSTDNMIERSRAFIKVQDGCDFYCSYCAIPYARGHSRSRNPQKVLDQIVRLAEAGYKEFVLGGINLGLYGKEKGDNYFLPDLLRDIESIDSVKKIRISSIEPQLIDEKMLEYFSSARKLCHHLHIPLQSASDRILKLMNRHYTTSEFKEKLSEINERLENAAFGLDVIVGFPGETDQDFEDAVNFLEELEFSYLHVFSYSKRPGTAAAKMRNHVNGKVIRERNAVLTKLSQNKTKNYAQHLVSENTLLEGIVEDKINGFWTALSDHYIRMYSDSGHVDKGDIISGNSANILNDGICVK
ncbi:MAG: tRNA (N(6)-L-threonylcarbamoyladenosine(37)-C(2))-methylthiotransferase MtaB [Candidatus Cloacimonetes bacterium]|nr:tRNA (N(6)-L-threonylcarbamoyladenosine(37)-C(2))-methylthiotransferase MtaB [Candidatus Cloacimonadota bacterium]